MRIFYVDDDENDRLLVARAARNAELPIEVDSAESGRAALARLGNAAKLPDLLLLDIKMPGMSGFELFEALKRAGLVTMPVVMFSSSDEAKDVQRARDMGADAYCIKPTGMSELVEFMRRMYWSWIRLETPCEWPEHRAAASGPDRNDPSG